ncbi:MAG: hypothetical protein C4533_04115 [Candidatus Omnitrophota bacterium]|jgi:hypothetical protein|nr:MAG: hypothetical protein C4533_04115 [Candidatus Omnitrophota bacterium]
MKYKKNIFIIIIVISFFVICEVSVRFLLFSQGKGFFRERRFVSPWFTVYDPPLPLEKDGIGYFRRGKPAARTPAPGVIRIICLGGSTTANVSTKIDYPQLLENKLNSNTKGIKFEVLNAAADAFSSAHSLVNFELRLIYYHPAYIIVYHNINDLSANYFGKKITSDYANKYMNNLFLAPECKIGFYRVLFKSKLISYILASISYSLFDKQMQSKAEDVDIVYGKDIFRNNLMNIVAVARQNGIIPILASQAACFGKNNFSYINKNDFIEYNAVIKDVASKTGCIYVDSFSALNENPEYFIDLVHYSESGVEKLADVFYDNLCAIFKIGK